MLKDRGEPVPTWWCIMKCALRSANCNAPKMRVANLTIGRAGSWGYLTGSWR